MTKPVLDYRPRQIGEAQWRRLRPFVVAVGLLTLAYRPRKRVTDLLGSLTRFAAWAEENGLPLEPVELFRRETIERFAVTATGLNSIQNVRSAVRRAAEALMLDRLGEQPPLRLVSRPAPFRPYTPAEMAQWLVWMESRPTALQRRNAGALIALGRGCGLAAEDLSELRGRDIERTASGCAIVHVPGRRKRRVDCRYAYEGLLLQLAEGIADDEWVFRPLHPTRDTKHLVPGWTEHHPRISGRGETEKIQLQRLRNSWIVELIDSRVPLPTLLKVAGHTTLHSLSSLLEFAQPVSDDEADELVRGHAGQLPGPKSA